MACLHRLADIADPGDMGRGRRHRTCRLMVGICLDGIRACVHDRVFPLGKKALPREVMRLLQRRE